MFAKTSKALERMNELFKKRNIQKVYWVVSNRKPRKKSDKLVHWLVKDPVKNVTTAHDTQVEGSSKAVLTYRYIGEINKHHLIEVQPETGRPHQIRVQMASIGCVIRGDLKYGYAKPNSNGGINLHARRLHFVHPIKKETITCVAGLPQDPFWEEFLELDDFVVKDKNLDKVHFA